MIDQKVIDIFKSNDIDCIATLPCDKIRRFLSVLYQQHNFDLVPLNKEEDGVGLAAGIYLGGGRPLLVIQSSGIGNSLNALLSLSMAYQFPLPIIASWRGVYKEGIAAQVPFSKDLPKGLEAWNIPYQTILEPAEVDRMDDVIKQAYQRSTPYVALVSPKIWNDDTFVPPTQFPSRTHVSSMQYERQFRPAEMTRYEALELISSRLTNEAVVCNIGVASKELYAAKDRPLNFYMTGSFGQATSIGMGVAMASKARTYVLDGDGSLLCTSILSVVAQKRPKNLYLFCLDNGTHGTTGDQFTTAWSQMDMELHARAIGFDKTVKVHSREELNRLLDAPGEGPLFVHVVIKPGNTNAAAIPISLSDLQNRFRKALRCNQPA
jgi:sulfopyruvate decarboxylase beta subunit